MKLQYNVCGRCGANMPMEGPCTACLRKELEAKGAIAPEAKQFDYDNWYNGNTRNRCRICGTGWTKKKDTTINEPVKDSKGNQVYELKDGNKIRVMMPVDYPVKTCGHLIHGPKDHDCDGEDTYWPYCWDCKVRYNKPCIEPRCKNGWDGKKKIVDTYFREHGFCKAHFLDADEELCRDPYDLIDNKTGKPACLGKYKKIHKKPGKEGLCTQCDHHRWELDSHDSSYQTSLFDAEDATSTLDELNFKTVTKEKTVDEKEADQASTNNDGRSQHINANTKAGLVLEDLKAALGLSDAQYAKLQELETEKRLDKIAALNVF